MTVTTLNLFNNSDEVQLHPAGHVFFREGDPRDGLFVVLAGEVELSVRGRRLDVASPGDIFGEIALIEKGPRLASAVARTDCRVVVVNEKRFLFLVQQTPFFAIEVMRILVARIRKLDRELGIPIDG